MRALVQRVSSARVEIENIDPVQINRGLLIYLGVADKDADQEIQWMVRKILNCRIFAEGTQSVRDCQGDLLIISQFTLYAAMDKGTRPSFSAAARPDIAQPIYEKAVAHFRSEYGGVIGTGVFGAQMKVSSTNDGPFTLWFEK